jgi:hypothetical protein
LQHLGIMGPFQNYRGLSRPCFYTPWLLLRSRAKGQKSS